MMKIMTGRRENYREPGREGEGVKKIGRGRREEGREGECERNGQRGGEREESKRK